MMKAYLEPQEVDLLEANALGYDARTRRQEPCLMYQLLIRLLFRLGGRVSEVLGITVDDIHFKDRRITIEHLKVRVKLTCPDCGARLSRTARFCPGCGIAVEKTVREATEHRRRRTLPVDEKTLKMLWEYINHPESPVQTDGKRLFPISRGQAWRIVREAAERAGLDSLVNPETGEVRGISPHRLRDAHAIRAVKIDDSGDGLRLLQEMLGHKSIETTMKYRKVAGQELEQWYDRLWKE